MGQQPLGNVLMRELRDGGPDKSTAFVPLESRIKRSRKRIHQNHRNKILCYRHVISQIVKQVRKNICFTKYSRTSEISRDDLYECNTRSRKLSLWYNAYAYGRCHEVNIDIFWYIADFSTNDICLFCYYDERCSGTSPIPFRHVSATEYLTRSTIEIYLSFVTPFYYFKRLSNVVIVENS